MPFGNLDVTDHTNLYSFAVSEAMMAYGLVTEGHVYALNAIYSCVHFDDVEAARLLYKSLLNDDLDFEAFDRHHRSPSRRSDPKSKWWSTRYRSLVDAMSEAFQLPWHPVIMAWACAATIAMSEEDEQACEMLLSYFNSGCLKSMELTIGVKMIAFVVKLKAVINSVLIKRPAGFITCLWQYSRTLLSTKQVMREYASHNFKLTHVLCDYLTDTVKPQQNPTDAMKKDLIAFEQLWYRVWRWSYDQECVQVIDPNHFVVATFAWHTVATECRYAEMVEFLRTYVNSSFDHRTKIVNELMKIID